MTPKGFALKVALLDWHVLHESNIQPIVGTLGMEETRELLRNMGFTKVEQDYGSRTYWVRPR